MIDNNILYFDYASSTPIEPGVIRVMNECMQSIGCALNPSNSKSPVVKDWIDKARFNVAKTIDADPEGIIWTSGATESNNLAIKGAAQFYALNGKHILISSIEHSSSIESAKYLESCGFKVSYVPVDKNGVIAIDSLDELISKDTILFSCQHVNNETGVIQPIKAISNWCRSKGILLHVDAAQSIGKVPFSVKAIDCDFVSLSSHKLFGPKGIGALWISQNPKRHLIPQIHGGNQEKGYRSGTLPTHQIVGIGEAYKLAQNVELLEIYQMNVKLEGILTKNFNAVINGQGAKRVPHIINVTFNNHTPLSIARLMEGVVCSNGAACQDAQGLGSHVLNAMGIDKCLSKQTVRFSISKLTTYADIAALEIMLDKILVMQ